MEGNFEDAFSLEAKTVFETDWERHDASDSYFSSC
jgi:hypothetical protein